MKSSALHFSSKLVTQPWHGTTSRARPLIASLLQKLRSERPDEDVFGDPLPKLRIEGDVAIIPVVGVLMINVPQWAKELGLNITDANDIGEELASATNNPDVSFTVLDFDSPGGWSIAGDKLFDLVEAANRRKRVFGWVDDGNDCCSSAYECAAPCTAILAGKHAGAVGCIGSYLALLDDTEMWKMMGVTWEVLRSGELKGIGEDGISEVQRAWLQSTVDGAGDTFRRNVQRYRTGIARGDMEGQYYHGTEAETRGFVGGLAKNLAQAITKFRRLV